MYGASRSDEVVDAFPRNLEALARPQARPMDFTGRPMGGFITIRPDGLKSGQLNRWVREAAARAESLPST